MSPAPREMFWDLLENDDARQLRAVRLRLVYALVDPEGWDGRRLGEVDVATLWKLTRP